MKVQRQRNLSLDGLRGLSCFLILICHTRYKGDPLLPLSIIGMDLFFVLSGFLITNILIREYRDTKKINFLRFWKRRCFRLFPAFYVYYFFGLLVYLITQFDPIIGDDPLVTLLSTGLYSSNWFVAAGYKMGIYTITWSLSLEEQFYILCPFLILLVSKNLSWKKVLGLFFLLIGFIAFYRTTLYLHLLNEVGAMKAWTRIYHGLDTRADSLLVGCSFAFLYNFSKIRIPTHLATIALIFLLAPLLVRDIPLAYGISQSNAETELMVKFGFTLIATFGGLLVLHFLQFPESSLSKIFANRVFVFIGTLSYSLYLWHTPVFGGLEIGLKSFNESFELSLLKFGIQYSLVFFIAYLSYRFVESRFRLR